nr:MAG TPA: hypothetical protein [Caudoviricetes sp.]
MSRSLRNLTLSVWQPGTAKPIYRLTTSSMHKERPTAMAVGLFYICS